MKKFRTLGAIFACALTLIACGDGNETDDGSGTTDTGSGSGDQAEVEFTFSWWGGDPRHEVTLELISAYEEENPHVKITPQYGPWDGWQDRFAIAFNGNQEPDLMQVNYNWITLFSPSGQGFYDLEELSHIINLDNYEDHLLEAMSSNGVLQALPTSVTSQLPFLNETLYEQAGITELPRTWDELMEAGRTIQAELGEDYFALGKIGFNTHLLHNYLIQTSGKQLINDDGQLNNTVEELEAGFQLFVDLIENGVIPHQAWDSENADELNQNWINGHYGGFINWESTVSRFTETIGDGQNIVAVPHFTMDGALASGILQKPTMGFSIAKNTEHPEEVARFLEWMISDPVAVEIIGTERGIPSNKAAYNHLEEQGLLTGLAVEGFNIHANANDVITMNPYFEHQNVRDVYELALENVVFEQMTPREAAEYVVEQLPGALELAINE